MGLTLATPLKMSHADAKQRVMPYTKIVEELPIMRSQIVDLVSPYVLVNNRAEGNAPLTIQALVDLFHSRG